MSKPLILVTNDDGVNAKGIAALIEIVKPLGEVVVMAPFHGNSGTDWKVISFFGMFFLLLIELKKHSFYSFTNLKL